MRTLKYIILFACAASSSSPHLFAGIIERDLLVPGDGLLTFDEVNQREWLDLPYTLGTLADVKSQMLPGEPLEGFKFATEQDVSDLNLSASPSLYDDSGIDNLIDSLGFLFRGIGDLFGIVEYTLGQVAVDFENDQPVYDNTNIVLLNIGGGALPIVGEVNLPVNSSNVERAFIVANPIDYEGQTIGLPNNFFAAQLATNDTGPFWLYRNVVPEPTPSLLLVFGIAALLMKRSRH